MNAGREKSRGVVANGSTVNRKGGVRVLEDGLGQEDGDLLIANLERVGRRVNRARKGYSALSEKEPRKA